MTQVRTPARTQREVGELVELARWEHRGSRFSHLPFSEAQCAQSFAAAMVSLQHKVLRTDGGFIVGVLQPMLFNRTWNVYEIGWFATDGSGILLLDALRRWAVGVKASALIVHNNAGSVPDARFTRVMGRKGFTLAGSTYMAELEQSEWQH